MRKLLSFSFILVCLLAVLPARAQNVGIKTNLLYDAALSPNLGIEIGLAPRWTLDISGQINAWTVKEHKWKHWLAQPEARYWLCERFQGNFFGLHVLGGQYNIGNLPHLSNFLGTHFENLKDHRYQGWGAGAGIAYGHAWVLGKHWNIEAEIGIGWIYTRYTVYPCGTCGTIIAKDKEHNYFGPTKAALNLVYLF